MFLSGVAFAGQIGDVHLKGYVADRMVACYRNHVAATDPMYYAREFRYPAEVGAWQTEFWGKYMLSAVPFAFYMDDAVLKEKIAKSVAEVCANQEDDGYIGNYPKERRAGEGWDLWGNKYTMLGLVTWYERTGDKAALGAAEKLAHYLMGIFGPGKRNLNETGCWRGLPSCSILEVIVKLHTITRKTGYLDFARYIVGQLDEGDRSPRLIREADVLPAERITVKGKEFWTLSSRKAYEMMSCYQGLIAYAKATGDSRALEAAVKTATNIAMTEINVVGGGSSHENWYGGAANQTTTHIFENETCVVTTWLRLCTELLEVTHDAKWVEEIEKTFYNAYLGAQRSNGSEFVQYTSLSGRRHFGENHSRLHTNCCTANGPRGYLAFLKSLMTADADAVMLNLYASGEASVIWPKTGERIALETYTLYPKVNEVSVRYRERERRTFKLKLRIPAWSKDTVVKLNGRALEGVCPGRYFDIDRTWSCGDQIDLTFDYAPQVFELNGMAAFKIGPLVLARDRRFGDGDTGEVLARNDLTGDQLAAPRIFPTRTTRDGMYFTAAGLLMTGVHTKNPGERYPSVVNFCDYASAGNTWSDDSYYNVWIPVETTPDLL